MHVFEHLTNTQLKKLIREYNLHVKISGYSKMSRDDLIKELKKHLHVENGIYKILNHEKELKIEEKIKKPREKKEKVKKVEPKPVEEKNVNKVKEMVKEIEKKTEKKVDEKINKQELIENFRKKLELKEKSIPGRDMTRYIKRNYETYNKDEQKILEEYYIKLINIEKNQIHNNFKKGGYISIDQREYTVNELEKRIKGMKETEYKTKKAKENNQKRIDDLEKELKTAKHELLKSKKFFKCIDETYDKMDNMKKLENMNDVNEFIKLVDLYFKCQLHFEEKEEEDEKKNKK